MSLTQAIDQMANVTEAFILFKQTHDYTELKISCCDRSKRLFEELEKLEAIFLKDAKLILDKIGH